MDKNERINFIKAMAIVASKINNGYVKDFWPNLCENITEEEIISRGYLEDSAFQNLMYCFSFCMKEATKKSIKGAFYCDGFMS